MEFKAFQRSFVERVSQNKSIDFSAALIPGGDLTLEEALNVYTQDYRARMQEALGKNFEATWVLLGDEEFFSLSREYILQNPSQAENLTIYGDSFVEFLEAKDLGDIVIQMAYFERSFWELFHRPDQPQTALTEAHLAAGEFHLQSYFFIHTQYDLEKIWNNREVGIGELSLDDLEGEKFYILFHSDQKAEIKSVEKKVFLVLEELKQKKKISLLEESISSQLIPSDWAKVFEILQYSQITL
jgi:hypothetical protein